MSSSSLDTKAAAPQIIRTSATRNNSIQHEDAIDVDKRQMTFYESISITLREPVNSMSISPSNRDVCLAARKGLFIIDLQDPWASPRLLPHMATWEVADVQWSIHPPTANLVVSTSSHKALVWNLELTAKSPIQHVLSAHNRSITDMNWAIFDINTLATCCLDGFINTWDLRQPRIPSQGFCGWKNAAAQVKWNRQNEWELASAHGTKVLIWDKRKGSVPTTTIKAHKQKIYGIDWSRTDARSLVTCSLDQTVKTWNLSGQAEITEPEIELTTSSPVWRARHTPFGNAIVTMPHRNENNMKIWKQEGREMVEVCSFEGHMDTCREFLWRSKGGENPASDDREFQLVSWGKDQQLRLWPVAPQILAAAGHKPGAPIKARMTRRKAADKTFRSIGSPSSASPTLLVGHKKYASLSVGTLSSSYSDQQIVTPYGTMSGEPSKVNNHPIPQQTPQAIRKDVAAPGYMTRGNPPEFQVLDHITWMEGIRVNPSKPPKTVSRFEITDLPVMPLHEEFTAAARAFQEHITFEKINVKARMCILSLDWAHAGSRRLRLIVEFPLSYPRTSAPMIRVDKTSRLSSKRQAKLLVRLRRTAIAETGQPSLSKLLEALLFTANGNAIPEDPEESEEEEEVVDKSMTVGQVRPVDNSSVPLRPCISGGVFGPDGQLVLFSSHFQNSAPNKPKDVKRRRLFEAFGVIPARSQVGTREELLRTERKRAIRNKISFSSDEEDEGEVDFGYESDPALRLAIFHPPTDRARRYSHASSSCDSSHPELGPGFSTVRIVTPPEFAINKALSAEYILEGTVSRLCTMNAEIAQRHNAHAAAKVWTMLGALTEHTGMGKNGPILHQTFLQNFIADIIELYHEDIQTIGMLACVLEKDRREHPHEAVKPVAAIIMRQSSSGASPRDYFSMKHRQSPGSARMIQTPRSPNLSNSLKPTASWASFRDMPYLWPFLKGGSTPPTPGSHRYSPRLRLPLMSPAIFEPMSSPQTPYHTSEGTRSSSKPTPAHSRPNSNQHSRRQSVNPAKVSFASEVDNAPSPTRKLGVIKIVHAQKQTVDNQLPAPLSDMLEFYRLAYAALLDRWSLTQQRAAVLALLRPSPQKINNHTISTISKCHKCYREMEDVGKTKRCHVCSSKAIPEGCSYCHLPLRGLIYICAFCVHPSHATCYTEWRKSDTSCPSGCGCACASLQQYIYNNNDLPKP